MEETSAAHLFLHGTKGRKTLTPTTTPHDDGVAGNVTIQEPKPRLLHNKDGTIVPKRLSAIAFGWESHTS